MLLDSTSTAQRKDVGGKAWGLLKLRQKGFPVPDFWIVPISLGEQLKNKNTSKTVGQKMQSWCDVHLPDVLYAVRSSSLLEDGDTSSHAGQFLTDTRVPRNSLARAVQKIIDHGKSRSSNGMAVVVQLWIEPHFSGVCFSRDPFGNHHHPVLEYVRGQGESLVSGEKTPKKVIGIPDMISRAPHFIKEIINCSKKIEYFLQFPADIEWAFAGENIFILQARPITTIRKDGTAMYRSLDATLSRKSHYLYDRTELGNTIVWATPFNQDLIRFIYRQGGPVAKTYKALGVAYKNTDMHTAWGPYLYIDKQKELASLTPAYEFHSQTSPSPSLRSWGKVWSTWKNAFAIGKIKTDTYPSELKEKLRSHLEAHWEGEDMFKLIDRVYGDIVLTGIIAMIASKKLAALRTVPNGYAMDPSWICTPPKESAAWIGNSLDPMDNGSFQSLSHPPKKSYTTPSPLTKNAGSLLHAIIYLREYARWISVKMANHIRTVAQQEAQKYALPKYEYYFFATKRERDSYSFSLKKLEKRHAAFQSEKHIPFPGIITDLLPFLEKKSEIEVLSPGDFKGVIIQENAIRAKNKESVILAVETLAPGLINSFGKISGIITKHGGILSHLAILAREKKIPIIRMSELPPLGTKVQWQEFDKKLIV